MFKPAGTLAKDSFTRVPEFTTARLNTDVCCLVSLRPESILEIFVDARVERGGCAAAVLALIELQTPNGLLSLLPVLACAVLW